MRRPTAPAAPAVAPVIAQAIQAMQKNRPDEAIQILEKLCQKNKRDPQAWFLLSSAYGQSGQLQEVIRCAEQVLRMAPNHAGSLVNLGNAFAGMGQHEEAAHYYGIALKQAPNDPRLLNNIGCSLVLVGQRSEAVAYFKRALVAAPNSPHAHAGLAEAFFMEGQTEEAMSHYTAALRFSPDFFKAHKGLGHVCRSIGDLQSAEVHYRQALRQSDIDIETNAGYAATLGNLGRQEDALRFLDEALAKLPGNPDLLAHKAEILEHKGEVEEAYRLVAEIESTGESNPVSATVFTRVCRRFACCDQALAIVNNLLEDPRLEVPSRQTLCFAAGALLDKLGRYDEAFPYFRQGNEAIPLHFDRNAHQQYVDSLIDTFAMTKLPALPRAGNADRRPIFIVGMPRSGTTLIEQILASHPEVFGAGELDTITTLSKGIAGSHKNGYPAGLADLTQTDLDKMAVQYLQKLESLAPAAPRITDKMPQNFLHLGLISRLFPKATIIHCRRNPLDTCLSIYFQTFTRAHSYATDLGNLGEYYLQYARLMNHWEKVLDMPILSIQYEELVANQEQWTRRMLEHCGLSWHEDCLRFHETKRSVATASYGQVREKMYSGSVERWRNYEQHIGPLLRTLAPLVQDNRSPANAS